MHERGPQRQIAATEDRHKSQIAEITRREAALFDLQLTPLRTLLSLLCTLTRRASSRPNERNHTRDLAGGVQREVID